MFSSAFTLFFFLLSVSRCRSGGYSLALSNHVTVAVVTDKTDKDNATWFDTFNQVVDSAVENVNNDTPGIHINLGPRLLSKWPNPMDVYKETCEKLNSTDVLAIIVTAAERTTFSLSVAGGFLGIPVIGLGSRSFSFSNKEVHPLFLRLQTSETNQARVIKSLLQRNAWFNFSIIASEAEGSDAFVQSLRMETPTNKGWSIKHDVRFTPEEASNNRILRQVSGDDSYVVILHCSPEEASDIFKNAKEMLGEGYALIGTESLKTEKSELLNYYPTGLLIVEHTNEFVLQEHLEDALSLVSRAARKIGLEEKERPNVSCWEPPIEGHMEMARDLYTAMTNTTFTGKTGNIVFDANGDLTDASYDVLNLIQQDADSPTEERRWKQVGKWKKGKLQLETVIWPGDTLIMPVGLDTQRIIVATNEEKPFIFFSTPTGGDGECPTGEKCLQANNSNRADIERAFEEFDKSNSGGNYSADMRCCTGLCVDLLNKIRADLNIKYELYLVADKNHGALTNGSWNGMVGDLMTGTADVAISSFSITSERSEVIDFTAPFFHSGFSTLVAKKERDQTLGAFLAPLSPQVWSLIFTMGFVVAIGLTIFEWHSPYGLHPKGRNREVTFGFPSALTNTYAILFCNTMKTKPPKCMTSRMMLNIWGGFSLFFFSSYTANLAAFLAGQMSYLRLEGIHDPRMNNPTGDIKIGTVTGSSIQSYLKQIHPKLDDFMSDYIYVSTEAAIEAIKSREGKLDVFIYDSPVIDYRMANDPDCSLVSVGKPFGEEGYGIGVSKGSPLRGVLTGRILEYELDGYLEELHRKWFESLGCMKDDILDPTSGGEDNTVTIAHVRGLLLMLVAGVAFAFLILFIEFVVHKWGVPYLRKLPKHRRDCLVFSQRLHQEINADYQMASSANIRDLFTLVKQKEFAKMLQKTQKPTPPEELAVRKGLRVHPRRPEPRERTLARGMRFLPQTEQLEYLKAMDGVRDRKIDTCLYSESESEDDEINEVEVRMLNKEREIIHEEDEEEDSDFGIKDDDDDDDHDHDGDIDDDHSISDMKKVDSFDWGSHEGSYSAEGGYCKNGGCTNPSSLRLGDSPPPAQPAPHQTAKRPRRLKPPKQLNIYDFAPGSKSWPSNIRSASAFDIGDQTVDSSERLCAPEPHERKLGRHRSSDPHVLQGIGNSLMHHHNPPPAHDPDAYHMGSAFIEPSEILSFPSYSDGLSNQERSSLPKVPSYDSVVYGTSANSSLDVNSNTQLDAAPSTTSTTAPPASPPEYFWVKETRIT